jgi:hypothetical protein
MDSIFQEGKIACAKEDWWKGNRCLQAYKDYHKDFFEKHYNSTCRKIDSMIDLCNHNMRVGGGGGRTSNFLYEGRMPREVLERVDRTGSGDHIGGEKVNYGGDRGGDRDAADHSIEIHHEPSDRSEHSHGK